jgi:hypothetical protein
MQVVHERPDVTEGDWPLGDFEVLILRPASLQLATRRAARSGSGDVG